MRGFIADFTAPGGSKPSRGTGKVSAHFEAADMTAFNTSGLATKHPALLATAGVQADFNEAYKVHSSSKDVLNTLACPTVTWPK